MFLLFFEKTPYICTSFYPKYLILFLIRPKAKQLHLRMKKTLFYVILAIFLAANLNAQNVNIPDANFKSALVNDTKINTNGDNEIQVSEAIAYSDSINVSAKNIKSLIGIEAFVKIKKLNCNSNQLATLDVSKNIALNTLYCAFGKLSVLDVSQNIALTDLRCNSNKIAALDISKNVALNYLNCGVNALTALDVSKNLALTNLNYYSNKLKVVDISKNTALTRLDCSINLDLTLDVSKNTALTFLDCGYNKLSAIDVSKNLSLTDLRCEYNQLTALDISKNLALTDLRCSFNTLTAVDLSKNIALTTFECFGSRLTTLDVSKNIALTNITCYNNQLSTLDVSKNIVLKSLSCHINQLTNLNLKNGANSTLETLRTKDNPLLKCIQVDDPTKIGANWSKDVSATYSANCSVATEDATIVQTLTLYPNPATTALHLRWEGDTELFQAALYNSVGSLVKSQSLHNQDSINITDLPCGLYLCNISDANHKIKTIKVVVE